MLSYDHMQQIVRVPLYKEVIMKSVRLFSLFGSIAFVHGLLGMEVEEDNKLIILGAGHIPTYMSKRSGKVAEDISPGGMKTIANYFPDELQLEITQRLMKNHPVIPVILQNSKLPIEKILRLGYNSQVNAIAWNPDSSKVITGHQSGVAKIWDVDTRARLHILEGDNNTCSSVAWSPDGSKVITGYVNGAARIWDIDTGARLRTFAGQNDWVRSVAWSPDGSKVIIGHQSGVAKIWDVGTGTRLHILEGNNICDSVAWSPDGSMVITGHVTAKIWDADTGVCLHTLTGHYYLITSVAWSPDGSKVITGSDDKTAKIWNAATGDWLHTLITGHNASIWSVAWSPDGSMVITGYQSGVAQIWDIDTGACLRTIESHTDWIDQVYSKEANILEELLRDTDPAGSVAWSPDGSKVLTVSKRCIAKIWNVSKLIEVQNSLNNDQILSCALLLNIIYKEAIAKEKIIILSHGETEAFNTLSPEVQHALRSHAILRSHATDSACAII